MSKIGQRGKKICSGKFLDGQKDAWAEEWTEGRTDRLTDHHRAPAEQGLNNYNSLLEGTLSHLEIDLKYTHGDLSVGGTVHTTTPFPKQNKKPKI